MRFALLTLILILLASMLSAQSKLNTDSLLKVVAALDNSDTTKVKNYLALGRAFINSDPERAKQYIEEATRLGIENDYTAGTAESYNLYGNIWQDKSDFDKAMGYYVRSFELYKEINSLKGQASALHNIAVIHYFKGDYDQAVSYNLQALEINEKLGNKENAAKEYINLGTIYQIKEDLTKAEEYFIKAQDVYKQLSNEWGVAMSHANMGVVAQAKGEYERSLRHFSEAELVFIKTGELQYVSICHNNMGSVYLQMENFEKAKEHFSKSLDIYEQLGDRIGTASVYMNLSEVLSKEKKYTEAIAYGEKALAIDIEVGSKPEVSKAYKHLSDIYERMGDPAKAYEYFKLYSTAKDSLLNEANSKSIAEMEAKYGAEKKQKEIELLNREKEKREVVMYAISGGLIMTLALGMVVFASYRQKRKANVQLAGQNKLIQEKNKDITDSINYAKRIQDAMLPSARRMKDLVPESFVFYQPKDIISGDFYWCTSRGEDIYIAAADCTGHGVPGALMSMIGINFLDQIVNQQNITDTSQVLERLHKSVLHALNEDINVRQSKDGMDISLIRINRSQRTIQFSGAVRPLYYVQNNEVKIIKGDRFSIGGILDTENDTFRSHDLSYTSPASFYMFSDGYIDQFGGPQGKKFMARSLQQLVLRIHALPAEEQKNIIRNEISSWKGSLEQVDDMLVIGVRI